LTRFHGHLKVSFGGVHDGEQIGPIHPGVQAADGRAGTLRAHPGIAGKGVLWVKQDTRDAGKSDGGLTSAEREELTRLRRENRKLKEERELLSKATAWFATEGNPTKRSSGS